MRSGAVEANGIERKVGDDQGMGGFSRYAVRLFPARTFLRIVFLLSPAFSGVQFGYFRWTGCFFWFGLLCKLFVDLGRNLKDKSSIPREIQGIGGRKFVAM
jgi:hypothetical protein